MAMSFQNDIEISIKVRHKCKNLKTVTKYWHTIIFVTAKQNCKYNSVNNISWINQAGIASKDHRVIRCKLRISKSFGFVLWVEVYNALSVVQSIIFQLSSILIGRQLGVHMSIYLTSARYTKIWQIQYLYLIHAIVHHIHV